MSDPEKPILIYELWTIRPANKVVDFATASEANEEVVKVIREKGPSALQNHAIMLTDDDDNVIDFAEQEGIPEWLGKRLIVDDSRWVSRET
jgi:hypothetical protein